MSTRLLQLSCIGRIIFLSLIFSSHLAHSQSQQSPVKISGAVDILGAFDSHSDQENRWIIRSGELALFAPIDPVFDGMVNFGGHEDEGSFQLSLHEAYISTSKLIPRSRLKVGQFLLGIGRLNQFHQHDWPFVSAPKVIREFFSPGSEQTYLAETAIDKGIEYSWLVPMDRFVELTFGIVNGYCFGHCHEDTGRPYYPSFYVHPTTFFEFDQWGMLLGGTYFERKEATGLKSALVGLDLTLKQRAGSFVRWLIQSEAYYQDQSPLTGDKTVKRGFYVYPEYSLDGRWQFGLRLDGFQESTLKFSISGADKKNFDWGVTPTFSYKPSEFSKLRLAYGYEVNTRQGEKESSNQLLQFQFIYILGAHPAHQF